MILVIIKSPEEQKRWISMERKQRRGGTEQIRDTEIPFEAETRVVRNEGEHRPWWSLGQWSKGADSTLWRGLCNLSTWCMQKAADVLKVKERVPSPKCHVAFPQKLKAGP